MDAMHPVYPIGGTNDSVCVEHVEFRTGQCFGAVAPKGAPVQEVRDPACWHVTILHAARVIGGIPHVGKDGNIVPTPGEKASALVDDTFHPAATMAAWKSKPDFHP